MTGNEYQEKAHAFVSGGADDMMYPLLGLAEEAGEVCGKVAKFIRKNHAWVLCDQSYLKTMRPSLEREALEKHVKLRRDISAELGDCMWMIAEAARRFGLSLDRVMARNLRKLEDRRARGVIVGEGDAR